MKSLTLVLGIVLVAACGGGDVTESTQGSESEGDGGSVTTSAPTSQSDIEAAQASLDQVVAELEGLDPDARRARLIELAEAEEGAVSFYAGANIDYMAPVVEGFMDDTGIEASLYRAGGFTLIQRVLQEVDAGYAGSDVLEAPSPFMLRLVDEGVMLHLDTPVAESIIESGRHDTWLAAMVNAYVAQWNTDMVAPEDVPETWEDVLTNFKGNIGTDPADYDWFMMMVTEYFMAERGMTEDEAVQFIQDGFTDGYVIRGHSTGAALQMAGEFAVHATQNMHRGPALEAIDAPVGWKPPIQPLISRTDGIGITANTARPASALLFLEYFLTDGQDILAEAGRIPASIDAESSQLDPSWRIIELDGDKLEEEGEYWEDLWLTVLRNAGTTELDE